MKTKLLLVLGALCIISIAVPIEAQLATKVEWSVLTTVLPDTIHPEFGTARDNWLTPLSMGISPTTGSRIGNVTAIEVRDVFDSSDMGVSTNTGLKLWRKIFSPSAPYSTMTGSRIYGTVIGVAKNGRINIDSISYRVLCDRVPLLNNQSVFTGLSYSVSRIGIRLGPSSILFAADNQILKNGESGTELVDAVVLIGGRFGFNANSQGDFDDLDTQITSSGAKITFEYFFNGGSKGGGVAKLYPSHGIPNNTNRMGIFKTPNGILFSVVGPTNSAPLTIESSRSVSGGYTVVTTAGTEGSSVFLPFTRNPTKEQGYVKWNDPAWTNSAPPVLTLVSKSDSSSHQLKYELEDVSNIPWATDDSDQDR